jgi:hypothetical protein
MASLPAGSLPIQSMNGHVPSTSAVTDRLQIVNDEKQFTFVHFKREMDT